MRYCGFIHFSEKSIQMVCAAMKTTCKALEAAWIDVGDFDSTAFSWERIHRKAYDQKSLLGEIISLMCAVFNISANVIQAMNDFTVPILVHEEWFKEAFMEGSKHCCVAFIAATQSFKSFPQVTLSWKPASCTLNHTFVLTVYTLNYLESNFSIMSSSIASSITEEFWQTWASNVNPQQFSHWFVLGRIQLSV